MSNKKKLIYTIITIVIIIAVAVGVIFALKAVNTADNQTPQTNIVTKATADSLKAQALKAELTNNTAAAKTLLEQANQQYKTLKDTEGTIDTEAQLYLLNHPTTKPSGI